MVVHIVDRLFSSDRITKNVVAAVQAELRVLFLAIDQAEVADGVLRNVKLVRIRSLIVFFDAVLEHFTVD